MVHGSLKHFLPLTPRSDIDHGMFVLNVDLWSADGTREVNLVRHSQTSPSISLTTPVSYAQVQDAGGAAYSNILPGQGALPRDVKFEHGGGAAYAASNYNPYPGPPQVNPYTQSPPSQVPAYGGAPQYHGSYPNNPNAVQAYPPQNGYSQAPGQPVYFATGAQIHGGQGLEYAPSPQPLPSQSAAYGGRPYTPADMNLHRMPVSSTQPGGMFTRNLIGSLAASAFRLTDPDDRIGIWFVLQDLSVRTEGTFRYFSHSVHLVSLILTFTQTTLLLRECWCFLQLPHICHQFLERNAANDTSQHWQGTCSSRVFLRLLYRLFGQKISRSGREHEPQQVLRDTGDQDPHPQGRPRSY